MTTTKLIELLKKYEKGGVTGKSREISLIIPTVGLLVDPNIEVDSTGDGIVGAEMCLRINGGKLYAEEDYPDDDKVIPEWVRKS